MIQGDPAAPSQPDADSVGSEREALDACGRGLMEALSLVRRTYAEAYRPLFACVYRFAASQLRGDLAAADEVATETLGRGWVHITSFRKEDRHPDSASATGNLRRWLLGIARNTCVDVARRRGMNVPLLEDLAAKTEHVAEEPAEAGGVSQTQLLHRLEELLTQLKPVVEELADTLPAFEGGRGRPTRGQRLSVALRDLGIGCDKTLEAFRQA